jgi:hypothetical protein
MAQFAPKSRIVRASVALGLLAGCSFGSSVTTPRASGPSRAATVSPTPSARSAPTVDLTPGLVWAVGGLPVRLAAAVGRLRGVRAVVSVANGTVWLPAGRAAPAGLSIPIDVSAADPRAYAAAMPAASMLMSQLGPGRVVLSVDSARLRGVHVGDSIVLAGVALRVAAIGPDSVVGGAEMFVSPTDGRRLGLSRDRYLLVLPTLSTEWPRIAAEVRRAVAVGMPLRIRAPGTARWLREADAVLPPLLEKVRFGELAADPRVTSSGALSIDPGWRARHLQTATVPILGPVTCNRVFFAQLRAALSDLVKLGLQKLVHPNEYGGCFSARLIPGLPGQPISHHAYGSAIDLNVSANPQGRPPHQDPRLVAVFASHGLAWGGGWLVPDGMHFEALEPSAHR